MTEQFPKNEVEFDSKFSSEQACFDYLFQLAGQRGSTALIVAMPNIG